MHCGLAQPFVALASDHSWDITCRSQRFPVAVGKLYRWGDFHWHGLAWVVLELALGPTAGSRVRATGVSVDLPLVMRTRRAAKVLEKIDAAVRASRDVTMQAAFPNPNLQPAGVSVQMSSEATSASPSIADPSQTNGF
jgi:hypothetical protein